MVIFVPGIILFTSALVVYFSSRQTDDPRRNWLITSISAAIIWLFLVAIRFQLPQSLTQLLFQESVFSAFSLEWQLDGIAWSLSFGFLSYFLITILSQVKNFSEKDSNYWINNSVWAVLAFIAALAANLLALIFVWFFATIFSLYVQAKARNQLGEFKNWEIGISVDFIAIAILIWTWLIFDSNNLVFDENTAYIILFVVLFRSGILPLQTSIYSGKDVRSSQPLGFIAKLFISLAIIPKLGISTNDPSPVWLSLGFLALLVLVFHWERQSDFQASIPLFSGFISTLAILFAAYGESNASLHWIIVLLLVSGLLPIFQHISIYKLGIYALGIWIFTPLPISPNFLSGAFIGVANIVIVLIYLISLALIISGWLNKSQALNPVPARIQSWQRTVFSSSIIMAIALLLILPFGLLPIAYKNVQPVPVWFILLLGVAAAGIYISKPLSRHIVMSGTNFFSDLISIKWQMSWLIKVSEISSKLVGFFTRLLEGSAGLLWAMLLVLLFLSLIGQSSLGGF
jgi:hypothetical protein